MIVYIIGLIVVSIIISYYVKKDIVYIIPMFMLASIVILYVFSVFDAMLIGVYTIYIIGLIGALLFTATAVIHRQKFIKSISLTPIIIFSVFGVLSLWAHNGRMITLWDEFSHWGRVVKDMYYLNALGTHPDSMVIFQNYPPGTALLQYLFVNIRGSFVESELYHGINIIYFALMMPLFKGLKAKNIFKIIIFMLIVIILPTGFYANMHESLYVDGLLGIFFAYILFVYFTNKLSPYNFINIALALFVLTIIKPSGVGIAFLALFIILVDFCFISKAKTKQYFKERKILVAIICILLPIVFVFIAKFSWSIYLENSNARISFDTAKITIQKIIDVFARFKGTETQNKIMINFFKAFTTLSSSNKFANFNFNIPPITFIILFMFIGAKLVYSEKDHIIKRRIVATGISLLIAGGIYFFTLLCSYLFMFGEYEGLRLASFTRYISSYLLGVYVFIVAYILEKNKNEKPKDSKIPKHLLIFFVIIAITGSESFLSITALAPFDTHKTASTREPYEVMAEIKDIVDKDENVCLIDIGSNGYSYHVGNYVTYPVKLKGLGSIGVEKYYEGDIWTSIITPDEWEKDLLSNYDYVYVYNTAYDFKEKYGHVFGGVENICSYTLYYVDKFDYKIILRKAEK